MAVDPIRVENDQKDLLIAQLKAEAFEMRQRERDYRLLHQQFMDLEHRHNIIKEEKVTQTANNQRRNEGDLASRVGYQESNNKSVKREIDDLNMILQDQKRKLGDLTQDLEGQLRMGDEKARELERMKSDHIYKDDINAGIREEIRNKEREIKVVRDSLRGHQGRLKEVDIETELKDKQISDQKDEMTGIQRQIDMARQQYDDLMRELDEKAYNEKRIDADVIAKQDSLRGLRVDLQRIDMEVQEMRSRRDHELKQAQMLSDALSQVEQRRDYLNAQISQIREQKKQLSYEEDKYRSDNDYHLSLKRDLDAEEESMVGEIEALTKHAELLREQNRGLSVELEDMVVCDEMIRSRLDRKNRVAEMRERNGDEMRRSQMHMERSKSPLRFSK